MKSIKFSPEHYQSLKQCIQDTFQELPEQGDKSETRYLWDIFWGCKWSQKFRDHYNDGDYKDMHIQTALKNIVKELTSPATITGKDI